MHSETPKLYLFQSVSAKNSMHSETGSFISFNPSPPKSSVHSETASFISFKPSPPKSSVHSKTRNFFSFNPCPPKNPCIPKPKLHLFQSVSTKSPMHSETQKPHAFQNPKAPCIPKPKRPMHSEPGNFISFNLCPPKASCIPKPDAFSVLIRVRQKAVHAEIQRN